VPRQGESAPAPPWGAGRPTTSGRNERVAGTLAFTPLRTLSTLGDVKSAERDNETAERDGTAAERDGDAAERDGTAAEHASRAADRDGTAAPRQRPYVLLSCAMSLDGYLDDATDERLMLSNSEDLDRVDAMRAECDAILVGANTIRRDNPRLMVRDAERRERRAENGLPPLPTKVAILGHGDIDPESRFFTQGDTDKIVYCATKTARHNRARLDGRATVVDGGEPVDPAMALEDLAGRGVRRLLVEGGSTIHTMFLTAGLVDELQLVIAPFFVGDQRAPRFVGDGNFPWHRGHRATMVEVRQMDDVVLLRYALSDRFEAAP
jgi:5-amino-6-(5-phosphoribosylamino)uracil reductase